MRSHLRSPPIAHPGLAGEQAMVGIQILERYPNAGIALQSLGEAAGASIGLVREAQPSPQRSGQMEHRSILLIGCPSHPIPVDPSLPIRYIPNLPAMLLRKQAAL